MESSRDSSVWRNLAVTFGGGLALGAVGMKLTQTALLRPAEVHPRPVEVQPRPEPDLLTERLSGMERRLERMEQSPASARAAGSGQLAGATLDHKVLEAVIGAVDARLHEHAGQMERRWADLEARLAVMQSLNEQDRRAAEQIRAEAAALHAEIAADMRQVRESTGRSIAGQAAIEGAFDVLRQRQETAAEQIRAEAAGLHAEIAADMRQVRESTGRSIAGQAAIEGAFDVLRQRQETAANATAQRLAEVRQELRQEFRSGLAELRTHIEQSMEARFVTTAAAAAAARMEEQLVPLRTEIQQKEKELGEMRQRLADSEQSVLDVVLAIGTVCRQAAERISGQRHPAPAPAPTESSFGALPNSLAALPASAESVIPPEQPPASPPALTKPDAVSPSTREAAAPPAIQPVAVAAPQPVATMESLVVPEVGVDPALSQAIPDFLHQNNYRSNWRVPLVSAALLSSGYLVLMHYLSLPLQ